jgi:hypothetical protein
MPKPTKKINPTSRLKTAGKRLGPAIRDAGGRFKPGTSPGPGRPPGRLAREEWRKWFGELFQPVDFREAHELLMNKIKEGNLNALKMFVEVTVGNMVEADLQEQIAELERQISPFGEDRE